MRKSFKFRLFPTRKQRRLLAAQLEECRWLYNHLLEQRQTAWEERQEGLTLYDQQATFKELKDERPSLTIVHSQVLQNIAVRVDLAFKAFFRRTKAGEKPGYPRFKGYGRYDSITFPQVPSGCQLVGDRLRLSKVGDVRIKLHRELGGVPKTCTVTRSSTGKWYACFSCEVDPNVLPESPECVGIDVGLESFAHYSHDERVENPRFFRRDEAALKAVKRRFSKEEKGTKQRERRRKAVARVHERVAFRRTNFAHQLSRVIVNRFGTIVVEDLNVNRMVHNHCLAKSISDAAWTQFFDMLFAKAEEAGRTAVKVNPAYTSQDCSRCGHRHQLGLGVRKFKCTCCGFSTSRDHNASLNILALGLQSLGRKPIEAAGIHPVAE